MDNARDINNRNLVLFSVADADNNHWASDLGRGTDRQENIQGLQDKIASP